MSLTVHSRNVLFAFLFVGFSNALVHLKLAPISALSPASQLSFTDMAPIVAPTAASFSSIHLAETQAWVVPLATFLDPFLNLLTFAMLARVVLSWYPETKISKMPWLLVALPTEPLLRSVKGVIPPAFGVDITPVFWLGLFTFIHEILLGQQGLLTMKIKYGI